MKIMLFVAGLVLAVVASVQLTGLRSGNASEDTAALVESQLVSPGELPVLAAQASVYERAIIGDGVVTREELLAAFGELNACVEDAAAAVGGVTVLPPDYSGDVPRLGGAQSADKSAIDTVGEAALACDDEYFDHVYAAWGSTTARDEKQPLWDAVATCLRGKGYDTPPGLSRTGLHSRWGSLETLSRTSTRARSRSLGRPETDG